MKGNATVRSRLGKLRDQTRSEFMVQVSQIYSSEGFSHPTTAAMVRQAVRAADETSGKFVSDAVSLVSGVFGTPEAFIQVHEAVASNLSDMQSVVELGLGIRLSPDLLTLADEQFRLIRQRSVESTDRYKYLFEGVSNKGGRPGKWDWEGVLIHLVGLANTPDGLPSGQGSQAEIEKIVSDWFIQRTGSSPVESEIRKRASGIMQQIGKTRLGGAI